MVTTMLYQNLILAGLSFINFEGSYYRVTMPQNTVHEYIPIRVETNLQVVVHTLPSGQRIKENRYTSCGFYVFSTLKLLTGVSAAIYHIDAEEVSRIPSYCQEHVKKCTLS